ncbi:MAG TPA: hypothetical protein VH280_21620 [Verrucomicrobiae bacterium]|jgi:hypothetical protein|nr:hypothetical protein [Verrucomicrobiae bacterium]
MKIIEYKVLSGSSVAQLAVEVNEHIIAGYQPYGPLAVLPSSGMGANPFFQPVVVYQKPSPNLDTAPPKDTK